MVIHTCYVVDIKRQLAVSVDKKTQELQIHRSYRVDDRLMKNTADLCLEALKFCVSAFQKD